MPSTPASYRTPTAARLGLDLSALRAHCKADHPLMRMRRANVDLAQAHARQHHRYGGALNHSHYGPDSPMIETGERGITMERPEGWYTGRGAVPKGGRP